MTTVLIALEIRYFHLTGVFMERRTEDEKAAGLVRNTYLGLQAPTPTGSRDQTKEAGLMIFPGAYRSNKVGYR